MGYLILE